MTAWNWLFRNAFTHDECAAIVDYGSQFPAQNGKVGAMNVESDVRKSTIRWLPRTDLNLQFLFDRLILRCLKANKDCFQLDIGDDPLLRFTNAQLTEYNADVGGKYDFHEDNRWVAPNPNRPLHDRKISCVLQLSPKESYEGGKLEFERDDAQLTDDFLEQGALVFFPSHLRHRVTSVTKGMRHSLVCWFEGPRMK